MEEGSDSGQAEQTIILEGPKDVLERIVKGLKEVYDPEIPVSVYDLGLIYEVRVEGASKKPKIKVKMSLTAIGCPVSVALPAYVEDAIREAVPEAEDVEVEVVFDPPWTPERVTPEGREMLKAIYGYDVVEQWKKMVAQQG